MKGEFEKKINKPGQEIGEREENTHTDLKLQAIAIRNQLYNNISLSKKGHNQLKD